MGFDLNSIKPKNPLLETIEREADLTFTCESSSQMTAFRQRKNPKGDSLDCPVARAPIKTA